MSVEDFRNKVFGEITRESRSVRQHYVNAFEVEANEFADVMGGFFGAWLKAYAEAQGNEDRMKVLALAYTAGSLHVNSMKLFLSGHQVAAGNLVRQAIEMLALAFLCTDRTLPVLRGFDAGTYSTKNALRDLRKHASRLKLSKGPLAALENAQTFYSHFSHPTKLTVGTFTSFAGEGTYVGAAFDPGKESHYKVEVRNRVKFAKILPGALDLILRRLDLW